MKRIETSVVIQEPIDQVFDYLIEPANLPDWAPGFLEATSTSEGPIRIGSTSKRITDFGGRPSETQHVVTGFDPNARTVVSSKTGTLSERAQVAGRQGGKPSRKPDNSVRN